MDLPTKPKPKPSQLSAFAAVNLIECMIEIKLRLREAKDGSSRGLNEELELVRRELTDYLLATDPRKGVYVKGPND